MKRLVVASIVAALLSAGAHADRRRIGPGSPPPVDVQPPQLLSISLEHTAMRAGEANRLFVRAEDDRSGVALVSGVFLSPSKYARIGVACHPGSDGVWECPIETFGCLDCGSWQLEQIQMMDKANNMAVERFDNPVIAAVTLGIASDSCDPLQPELTMLVLEPNVVSNAEASTIQLRASVFDNACGVASVTGQAMGPNGERTYFSFSPSGDPNTWIGQILIPKLAGKGVWAISWIQLLDKGRNLRTYSSSDAVLSGATFRVQ